MSVKAPYWNSSACFMEFRQPVSGNKLVWSDFHAATFNKQQPPRRRLAANFSAFPLLLLLFSDKRPWHLSAALVWLDGCVWSAVQGLYLRAAAVHTVERRLSGYSASVAKTEIMSKSNNGPWVQMCCCCGDIIKLFEQCQHCAFAPANPRVCMRGCHEHPVE